MAISYTPEQSNKRFRIPKSLVSDFENFLNHDVPGAVGSFVILQDWYSQFEDDYNERTIRTEIYPDSTKSRYEDVDNNQNVRFSRNETVRKGDYLIDPWSEEVYLLDWEINQEPNCKSSRAVRCNLDLTVKRSVSNPINIQDGDTLVDEFGFAVHREAEEYDTEEIVVDACPCNAYHYDGRPEYSATSSSPGTIPSALTILNVQCNSQTKCIHINDWFEWGPDRYTIIDVNYVGINRNGTGTLKVQAKKTAGGINYAY